MARSWRIVMFRASPSDSTQDSRLQRLFEMVKEEFFAVDQTAEAVNFADIEDCAHEARRKVARLLCEQAASQAGRKGVIRQKSISLVRRPESFGIHAATCFVGSAAVRFSRATGRVSMDRRNCSRKRAGPA